MKTSILVLITLLSSMIAAPVSYHMKFEYSNAFTQKESTNKPFVDHVKKTFDIVGKYFQDLINVESGATQDHLTVSVELVNEPNESFIANARRTDSGNSFPTSGQVNINEAIYQYTAGNLPLFEGNLETLIHEVFHILGISKSELLRSQPANFQEDNGSYYVVGGEALTYAQQYFGEAIEKLPFENEGGAGSQGSHWERMFLRNEMMSASAISSDAVITKFTTGLLKGFTFYAQINDEFTDDSVTWGKGKGQAFVTDVINKNCQLGKYREFSPTIRDEQCDFHHFGFGADIKQTFSNGCYVMSMYSNTDCTNPLTETQNSYETVGRQSKCFMSNIGLGNFNFRCFQYYCSKTNTDYELNIQLMDNNQETAKIVCGKDDGGKEKTAPGGINGNISCPDSIDDFCHFPIPCLDYCSENGYCLRKEISGIMTSKCHCLEGYAGKGCETKLDAGNIYVQENSSGSYVQVASCGIGYTADIYDKVCNFGVCSNECSRKNQICYGPGDDQCVPCIDNKFYHEGNCIVSCPTGYYPSVDSDYSKRVCVKCQNATGDCLTLDSYEISGVVTATFGSEKRQFCSKYFTENNANVICKEKTGNKFKSFEVEQDCNDSDAWVTKLSCKGDEESISQCSKEFELSCDSKCVKIECDSSPAKELQTITSTTEKNRMMVYKDGIWGGICNEDMSLTDLQAICKSSGKDTIKQGSTVGTAECPDVVHIFKVECSEGDDLSKCEKNIVYTSAQNKCDAGNCLKIECDVEKSVADQTKELVQKQLKSLPIDGVYKLMAYFFGLGIFLLMIISSVTYFFRCSKGDFQIKNKKKGASQEDYYMEEKAKLQKQQEA